MFLAGRQAGLPFLALWSPPIAKLSLLTLGSSYNSLQNINANSSAIEAAMENTLSRDGTSPNQMEAVLDMNNNRILNLPTPSNPTDPVRYEDLLSLVTSLTLLDSGLFLSVTSILATPPGSPTTGSQYLVAHSATTGAFVGHEDQLAQWTGTAWAFTTAFGDQDVLVQSNNTVYHHAATSGLWVKKLVFASPGDNLQTRLTAAAGITLVILGGTYTSVNMVFSSNTTLFSLGEVILQTTSNSLPIWDFSHTTDCVVRGRFVLQGNGPTAIVTPPITNLVNNGQVGIYTYDTLRLDIDGDIEITNIAGYGVDEHAPDLGFRTPGGNSFKGLRVHDCYFGAYVRDFAEYSIYQGCFFYQNLAGIKDESGNRGYYNCIVSDNNYGMFFDGTVETGNNSHGIVSGCFINHNNVGGGSTGASLTFDGCQLGMLFVGCQILSDMNGSGHGFINVIGGSKLINFVGCGIGADVHIDSTSQAFFTGNTIRSALSSVPTVDAGGQIQGTGNVDDNNNTAFLWNGVNSWTPILQFGGASVGITYSVTNGRYRIADGFCHFTAYFTLSSKGSSTGVAQISGLPIAVGASSTNQPVGITGTGLNSAVTDLKAKIDLSDTAVKLYNFNTGSRTQLTDTAFTGSDTIEISGFYPIG